MGKWDTNARANETLWTTLYLLNQLFTNYKESGSLAMKDLTFYNPLVSSDFRRNQALMLADQLDNVFRMGRGAIFEPGVERGDAILKITGLMTDGEKTVEDLAELVDDLYKFWQE